MHRGFWLLTILLKPAYRFVFWLFQCALNAFQEDAYSPHELQNIYFPLDLLNLASLACLMVLTIKKTPSGAFLLAWAAVSHLPYLAPEDFVDLVVFDFFETV